jgi:hypothetical protein
MLSELIATPVVSFLSVVLMLVLVRIGADTAADARAVRFKRK